jgi:hypothetical protein
MANAFQNLSNLTSSKTTQGLEIYGISPVKQGNPRVRQWICVCSVAFVLCLSYLGNTHADSPKAEKIRHQLMEILSLREAIREKSDQAIVMRSQLEENMTELKKEIENEQIHLELTSYQKAIRSPRVYYDLKLIQQLLAYILKFDEKIGDLKAGAERLEFLYQLADDDLRIVETLNDMEVEDLMNQINSVIREQAPKASSSFFDVNEIDLRKLEKIWDEIASPKELMTFKGFKGPRGQGFE